MVLHIGSDVFVPLEAVVAVLDIAALPGAASAPPAASSVAGEVRSIGAGPAKSVVVTAENERRVFFLSPISASTLRRRAEQRFG